MSLNLKHSVSAIRCLQLPLVLCLAGTTGGCIAEKSLGDPGATDGAEGSGTTADGPTGGPNLTTPQTQGGSQSSSLSDTQGTNAATEGDGETDAVDTDTIEPGACADYTPPPIECEPPGEAVVEYAGSDFYEAVDAACTVTFVEQDDFGTETIGLGCGEESFAVGYTSRSPHLGPPVAVDDDVLFSYRDYDSSPNLEPSFTLASPEGDLLLAFVMHMQIGNDIPVALSGIEVAYAGTGCAGFEVPAAACESDDLSIVAARVDVDISLGDELLVLSEGGTGVLGGGDTSFGVSVGHAQRIACWDEGCNGDKAGPFDLVELLIVAQP